MGEVRAQFCRGEAEPGGSVTCSPEGWPRGSRGPPTARPGCPGVQGPGHHPLPGSNPLHPPTPPHARPHQHHGGGGRGSGGLVPPCLALAGPRGQSDTTTVLAVPTMGHGGHGQPEMALLLPGQQWDTLGVTGETEARQACVIPPPAPQGAACPGQVTGVERQALVALGKSRAQPVNSRGRILLQEGPRAGAAMGNQPDLPAQPICRRHAPVLRTWFACSGAGWGPMGPGAAVPQQCTGNGGCCAGDHPGRWLGWGHGCPVQDGASAAGQGRRVSCTGWRHGHTGLNWEGVLGLTGGLHAVLGAPHTGWDGGAAYWAGLGTPCAGSAGGAVSHWAEGHTGLGCTGSTPTLPGSPAAAAGPRTPPGSWDPVPCTAGPLALGARASRLPGRATAGGRPWGGGCPSATPPLGDLDPSVWVPSSRSHLTA